MCFSLSFCLCFCLVGWFWRNYISHVGHKLEVISCLSLPNAGITAVPLSPDPSEFLSAYTQRAYRYSIVNMHCSCPSHVFQYKYFNYLPCTSPSWAWIWTHGWMVSIILPIFIPALDLLLCCPSGNMKDLTWKSHHDQHKNKATWNLLYIQSPLRLLVQELAAFRNHTLSYSSFPSNWFAKRKSSKVTAKWRQLNCFPMVELPWISYALNGEYTDFMTVTYIWFLKLSLLGYFVLYLCLL